MYALYAVTITNYTILVTGSRPSKGDDTIDLHIENDIERIHFLKLKKGN